MLPQEEQLTSPSQNAASAPEQATTLPEVKPLELRTLGPSRVFESATTRVIEELRENPIDPFYSAAWPTLAHQVVGQERF